MFRRPAPKYLTALIVAITLNLPAFSADPVRPKGYQAITKPSKEYTASFVRPGRVAKVLVAKGDEVRAKQLIAHQDDTEEQAALAADKMNAEDDTEIRAEEAVSKQAAITLQRTIESNPPILEIEKAKLEVTIDEARIQIAKIKLEQAKLKYNQSKIAVDKLNLYSEIDGLVSEEFLQAGESADGGNMKVVHIVQLDPLRVDVPVPVRQAVQVKKGDIAVVTGSDGKEHSGKVTLVPLVIDSASETILIRVEVPNPDNPDKMRDGDNVYVNFGQPAPQIGTADQPK